ncbi:dihydrodipicolinate synthase family protein [Virgibacillus indicus]|nr:dihydrodipicolinate synthase family protein [Virgibacillus indicus]
MGKFEGILPILATPFSNDGELDYESLENLTEYLAGSGVHGITMFGIASEFHKLTDSERDKMTELTIQTVQKRLPVIVSITDQSWEAAVKRAVQAERLGADGIMIFPPFFLNPLKAEIRNHILKLANAVDIPVIVQYAPNQSGIAFDSGFFVKLNEEAPNIQYVKVESTPPGPTISSIASDAENISCLVGYAGVQMIDALNRGAVGVQPGCSFTEPYVEIYKEYQNGNKEKAFELHRKMLPLLNLLMQNVELIIQAEKEILYRRGIIKTPYCRSPKYSLDAEQHKQMNEYLKPIQDYFL